MTRRKALFRHCHHVVDAQCRCADRVDFQNREYLEEVETSSFGFRFLDEIALLKRGKITRDTPKNTYKRGLSAEDGAAVITNENRQIALFEAGPT
ncbi:unnamed protein product [Heligmosomoides polygyrus]|uniref:DM domain-containing protein n=1 Tax=Heligmosomoides polygyrus TaxID=6339 RepID=A0A183GD76_HELPZ|nr:unnamed protein product [Heligmosomoides polygyrus]